MDFEVSSDSTRGDRGVNMLRTISLLAAYACFFPFLPLCFNSLFTFQRFINARRSRSEESAAVAVGQWLPRVQLIPFIAFGMARLRK